MAFTIDKYEELVNILNRVNGFKDIRTVFNKTITVIESNMSEALKIYQAISEPTGTDVDTETVQEMVAIYQAFNSAVNTIKDNHEIFLTGQASE